MRGGESAEAYAAEVVRKAAEGGRIDPDVLTEVEDDRWDRLNPRIILIAAIEIILRDRSRDDSPSAVQVAPRYVELFPAGDVLAMTRIFLGDVSAVSEGNSRGYFTLPGVVGFLSALLAEESMSRESADRLVSAAVEVCRESLCGDVIRRGLGSGPWDIEEIDVSELDLIDMGGILVLESAGMEVRPIEFDGQMLAVTLVRGDTAVQLQAFRADSGVLWESVRTDMVAGIRAQGGRATEWVDRAGVEIRASVPRVTESGHQVTRDIRVLGSDGPGWMLRAVVSGAGAASGNGADWAYATFLSTVVVGTYALSGTSDVIGLHPPTR
ncbi:DUF3710 domain-containing protein [Streptomyces sp. NPDC092952]|uniref:DUF3710 domain-containing protein n=1 Tax=Streptomyces sp. NPDC092952 TaxID=3366018 RepID=UPI00382774F2